MEKSRQQRKIERAEWPAIAARHSGGESLASIARAYGCTAPAIRYIVERQRTAQHRDRKSAMRSKAGSLAEEPSLHDPLPGARSGDPRSGEGSFPLEKNRATTRPASAIQSGLSLSFRESIMVEVSAFLVAFDAVVRQLTDENLELLRTATDRLLRAAARVRIELERGREDLLREGQ